MSRDQLGRAETLPTAAGLEQPLDSSAGHPCQSAHVVVWQDLSLAVHLAEEMLRVT